MSGKKAKENRNSKMVDISTLRLGLDIETGKVILGAANEEGVIDHTAGVILDITEDFFNMVKEITELRMAMLKKQEEQAAQSKIIIPTEAEKNLLGRK